MSSYQKAVVVIASGATEQKVLPVLLRKLQQPSFFLCEVLVPRGNRQLVPATIIGLIQRAYYGSLYHREEPNKKIIVLLDTDTKHPQQIIPPVQTQVLKDRRIKKIVQFVTILFAYAQQHLEAWFFADDENLRNYLGRPLGRIPISNPDQINNPKLHLIHLLQRPYTSFVAEKIAQRLDPATIARRSPSFAGFCSQLQNGFAFLPSRLREQEE